MSDLVLVVDDNPVFRDLARRILEGWGHEVIEAGSAADALVQALAHQPTAALVDIGLADGDGFELTRRLVGLPAPVRVVLTSADSDPANAGAAARAGALGFVAKVALLTTDLRRLMAGT